MSNLTGIIQYMDGYVAGLGRANRDYGLADETHLYEVESGHPMCQRGWNRDWGTGYSIFRGNVGDLGVCPECIERAKRKEQPIPPSGFDVDTVVDWNKEYTPLHPGLPLTTPEIEALELEIEVEEVASYLWQQPIDRLREICDVSEGSEEFISTIAKEFKCWNHEAIRQAILQVKNEMITD